jgi:tetratricopeptide (TPR) repeat protein
MAKTWNTRGLEAAQHSNWNQALESWDNALEIYQTLLSSSHTHVANVQNNRGIALGKLQRTDEALQALQRALEIRQNNHDDTATATLTVVTTLHNIANVHQETGNFADALRVLALAKDMLWTTTNNNNNIDNDTRLSLTFPRWHQSARLCTAMGHVYHQAEQWRDAREAYHDALHIYQRLVDFVDAHHTTDRPRLAEPSPPPPPPPRDSLVHELWAVRADLEEMETRRLSMLLLLHDFSHEEKHDEMLDRDREYVPPSPRCCGDATASPATDSVAKASSSVWRRILPTR